MPITITVPPVNGPVGPGISAFASLDLSLFQAGDSILMEVRDELENHRIVASGRSGPLTIVSGEVTMGKFVDALGVATWVTYPQYPTAVHGDTVHLQASHMRGGLIIEQTALIPQKYDALTGLQYLLPNTIQAQSGGYAQADRDRDIRTNTAVLATFPLTDLVGSLVDIDLGDLPECPPAALLRPDSPQLLFGDGTLTRPSGTTGVYAYGFTFRSEVIPPGLSVIDGVALEYPERLAQFLLIRVDSAGNEYVADRWEFHHDQERICWGIPFPKRLEYSILPGVSLRFSWLLFPVAQ